MDKTTNPLDLVSESRIASPEEARKASAKYLNRAYQCGEHGAYADQGWIEAADMAHTAAVMGEEVETLRAMLAEQDAALERMEALVRPYEDRPQMDAYYYGFTPTGVEIVDRILSAVAVAGKAYHHTESWTDQDEWTNPSHAARIQQAAEAAATSLRATLTGEQPTS
jgi:hypothetical protein